MRPHGETRRFGDTHTLSFSLSPSCTMYRLLLSCIPTLIVPFFSPFPPPISFSLCFFVFIHCVRLYHVQYTNARYVYACMRVYRYIIDRYIRVYITRICDVCVCARERGLNVCARYVSSSRDVRCLYANRKLTISSTRAADRPTTFLLFPSLFPFFFPFSSSQKLCLQSVTR